MYKYINTIILYIYIKLYLKTINNINNIKYIKYTKNKKCINCKNNSKIQHDHQETGLTTGSSGTSISRWSNCAEDSASDSSSGGVGPAIKSTAGFLNLKRLQTRVTAVCIAPMHIGLAGRSPCARKVPQICVSILNHGRSQ